MVTRNKKQSGFTLIELLVVVIIVAVLAAVGIPLLTGNIQRARASEAEAGLGTIRTSIRAYIAENKTLPATLTLANVGLQAGDLDGRFFDDAAYKITPTVDTAQYCIDADGTNSTAPQQLKVQSANLIQRSMDEKGGIYDSTGCSGGTGTLLNP